MMMGCELSSHRPLSHGGRRTMTTPNIAHPPIASHEEWLAARKELLAKEKESTRARDALSAQRRRLPMVRIDKDYVFAGTNGPARLLDLFDGRRQLIIYHFSFAVEQPSEGHGISVFFRLDDAVFHTYSAYARGTEGLPDTYG